MAETKPNMSSENIFPSKLSNCMSATESDMSSEDMSLEYMSKQNMAETKPDMSLKDILSTISGFTMAITTELKSLTDLLDSECDEMFEATELKFLIDLLDTECKEMFETTEPESLTDSLDSSRFRSRRDECIQIIRAAEERLSDSSKRADFYYDSDRLNDGLLVGIIDGAAETVSALIKRGANVDADYGCYRCKPIHYARSPEIVDVLLANGANIDATDYYGYSALVYASWHKRADVVSKLIQSGASVAGKNELALLVTESVDVIELLLAAGIDINAQPDPGRDALFYNVRDGGHVDVIIALIKAGIRLDSGYYMSSFSEIKETAISTAHSEENWYVLNTILACIALKVANLDVCKSNVRALNYEFYEFPDDRKIESWLRLQCQKELEELKRHRLSDAMTLYDVLYIDNHGYLRDREVAASMSSVNFCKYPRYGDLIAEKYGRHRLLLAADAELLVKGKSTSNLIHRLRTKSKKVVKLFWRDLL